MVGLVIYWDIHPEVVAVNAGSKRWLSSYIFSMEAFGADKLFVVGEPDGKPKINHGYVISHTEHDSFKDIKLLHPTAKYVALVGSHPESVSHFDLKDYIHPKEDVIYVIGGDYSDLEFDLLSTLDVDYVHIESIPNSTILWSNVVAGIALRDRYVKGL